MERQFVEIAFRQAGELFLFDTGGLSLSSNDRVVVETEHGQALGTVKSVKDSTATPPNNFKLYRVVRMASSEDLGRELRHQRKEREAYDYCNQKIVELALPMKLIKAEYFFSGSKLLFYFSAEGRVDFRMLVRDLARYFQKRIEMRQIGVRDSAKLIGGVGPCGQQLCCNRFLRQFNPVSIRMAKDQSLPLNPQKVSGVCGRLMCCLAYEQGMYQTMRKRLPRIGEEVETTLGRGKVRDVHPLQETVRVVFFQHEPPTEEELHISALPEFREIPVPEQMPLNMGGKPEKGGRGRRRTRRGLEPLMEPRQPGRSTPGSGGSGGNNRGRNDNKRQERGGRDEMRNDDNRGATRRNDERDQPKAGPREDQQKRPDTQDTPRRRRKAPREANEANPPSGVHADSSQEQPSDTPQVQPAQKDKASMQTPPEASVEAAPQVPVAATPEALTQDAHPPVKEPPTGGEAPTQAAEASTEEATPTTEEQKQPANKRNEKSKSGGKRSSRRRNKKRKGKGKGKGTS